MSTFTQFNGQQGSGGASARDITAFIEAYNNLSAILKAHMTESLDSDFTVSTASNGSAVITHGAAKPVHGFVPYVDKVANKLATIEALDKKADKSDFTVLSGKVASLPDNDKLAKAIKEKADALTTMIEKKANIETLKEYTKLAEFNLLKNAYETFYNVANAFLSKWSHIDADYKLEGSLRATKALIGMLQALKTIDFIQWSFVQAPFSGTGSQIDTKTNGVYILARISDLWENENLENLYRPKAGRMFVKYVNTAPFDAIVDFTVSYDKDGKYNGAMTVLCSKRADEWASLKFHIIKGTDSEGNVQLYLAMSDERLAPEANNSTALRFRVAGINIIPFKEKGFELAPNGLTDVIVSSHIRRTGLSAASINTDELITDSIIDTEFNNILHIDRKEIEGRKLKSVTFGDASFDVITFYRRPSMLFKDPASGMTTESHLINEHDFVFSMVPIGAIVRWGLYHDKPTGVIDDYTGLEIVKKVLDNVPSGWLVCDGSPIDKKKYPELFELYNGILPVEDLSIIRAGKIGITPQDVIDPDIDTILTHIFLNEKINKETKRAKEEEARLDVKIDTEQARAEAAEQKLTDDLDTEKRERIEADNTEKRERIEADNTEKHERIEADNTEKHERIEADNTEKHERIEADNTERLRAEAAEQKLTDDLEAEVNRSTNKDVEHNTRITALENKDAVIDTEIDKLDKAIKAEAQTRETADTTEKQRAINAEEALGVRIDTTNASLEQEVTRATAAETRIEAKADNNKQAIDIEKGRAEAAEQEIKDSVATEKGRAEAAEQEIKDSVATEKGRTDKNIRNVSRLKTEVEGRHSDTPVPGWED